MRKIMMTFVFLILLAGMTSCFQKDTLKENVDKAIEAFLDNYASDYLKDTGTELVIDFHVAAAIAALAKNGYDIDIMDYLDKTKVEDFYEDFDYSQPKNAFIALMNCRAFNVEYSKAEAALATYKIEEVDPWSITYTLMALNVTKNNSSLRSDLLAKVNVIRAEDYRDADYAGAALMATYQETLDKSALFALIDDNLSKDGVIAWDNANANSTAYAILGLIALGIDPTSAAYTIDDVNLIEALLGFEKEGAFSFTLNGEIDLAFSTPQAFSALVAYKIYSETEQPFVLFG